MLDGIAHVELAVRSLSDSRSLYERLGLSPVGDGTASDTDHACLLEVGPSILELRQETVPLPSQDAGEREPVQPPVIDHFALLVEDMSTTYAALKERDIPTLGEPAETAIGHRNMQRSLLAFKDPDGLHVQISETIDPRPQAEERKAAKRRMAEAAVDGLFGGFDHISTYCRNFGSTRAFFGKALGMEEFFHSTTREAGTTVAQGFGQAAFAVGGTDIELATAPHDEPLQTRVIKQLSFWTANLDGCIQHLESEGVDIDGPGEWSPVDGTRHSALAIRSPDGLDIRIVEH